MYGDQQRIGGRQRLRRHTDHVTDARQRSQPPSTEEVQATTLEAAARLKALRHDPDRARLPVSFLASPVQRKRFLRERVWPRMPAKPLVLFVYMYVLRAGFLDGGAGLALCAFHAFQEFMVGLKLAELCRISSRRA